MMSTSPLQSKKELNDYRYPYRSAGIFASSSQVKRVPAFSVSDLFDVFTSALAMTRAVPDSGRVSAKDMAKVRLIAEAL